MPSTIKTEQIAELSVPSKTFLLGEYSILLGGPAILVATTPRFHMRVFRSDQKTQNFHPDSPAGIILKNQKFFFEFVDPYSRSGGLGASSAQYALGEAFLNPQESWQHSYDTYRALSQSEEEWNRPSGADVVSQLHGGIGFFRPSQKEFQKLSWSFRDLEFSLFKTSQKLATHEHLKNNKAKMLEFEKVLPKANQNVEDAQQAIIHNNAEEFVQAF